MVSPKVPDPQDVQQQQMAQAQAQAAAFRQQTGGVPATVYLQKLSDGFRVVVRMNDGSSSAALGEALANTFGAVCQNFGMTIKV